MEISIIFVFFGAILPPLYEFKRFYVKNIFILWRQFLFANFGQGEYELFLGQIMPKYWYLWSHIKRPQYREINKVNRSKTNFIVTQSLMLIPAVSPATIAALRGSIPTLRCFSFAFHCFSPTREKEGRTTNMSPKNLLLPRKNCKIEELCFLGVWQYEWQPVGDWMLSLKPCGRLPWIRGSKPQSTVVGQIQRSTPTQIQRSTVTQILTMGATSRRQ